ncbi:unnamed protein product [Clonostachys byssicola]|uniref:Anaphase-promoting complex, subunit CDC26 n=1 Tax=Clonostachys byssicola TaxID=160290 RepID=A0A9N9UDG3_9HYPO|nr:unnamed protein product [Clonostachys byssicola]
MEGDVCWLLVAKPTSAGFFHFGGTDTTSANTNTHLPPTPSSYTRTLPQPTTLLAIQEEQTEPITEESQRDKQQETMLRRPATSLTITSEDVAAYEDRRSREAIALDQQQRQQQQQGGADGTTASGSPSAEDVLRRAREERIGVGRRRGA